MRIKSILLGLSTIVALAAGATQASAAELVTNGGFETGDVGQIGYNGNTLAGWTTTGYNFLFSGNSGGVNASVGQYGSLELWNANNGVSNGLGVSPVGGKFVGADGAFGVSPISQTINGLVAGQQYSVSFYWGGAQQSGFSGATTEQWQVSLGAQTLFTEVKSNDNHGFTGWEQKTMTFTATAASEVLSFLAIGTPSGVPPFSLLDGVSMVAAVPEPETYAMLGLGLGLMAVVARRRKAKAA